MAGRIDRRLDELGLTLPNPFVSRANYIPHVRSGDLLFVAGQGPMRDGAPASIGKVGGEIDEQTAYEAARLTGLNLVAQARHACDGDLDRVLRCVRLFGLINAVPGFTALPQVMNGASDLMVALFGEAGRHARTTIGAVALPHDMTIEIDGVFALR